MRGPCGGFIGDNKGRLPVVATEKSWVKDTKPSWKRVASEFSVGDSHGKFVVEEELKSACEDLTCELKTLCVL
jgi:hypothetical protein